MIWQLMKLDVGWRYVQRQTILFAAVAAIWHVFTRSTGDDDGAMWTMFAMVFAPLFSVGFTPLVQPLDTPFQATLPVTVREVFLVRMVSALAQQWLPTLAGCIMLMLLGEQPASGATVQTWWIFTCMVLCGQCAGILGLRNWGMLRLIAVPVVMFGANLVAFALEWPFRDLVAWNLALIGCWLFTAAVVARTWQIIPKVFALAPSGARSDKAAPILTAAMVVPRGAWWRPVLGTLFPAWGIEYLVAFLAMCILYSPLLALVLSAQGWTSMRTAVRWMLPLPVPRRVLLVATVLPGVLALSCGYLVGVNLYLIHYLHPDRGLRSQIVSVAFIAGWSMAVNLCALAGDWHIVRRVLPSWNWPVIFASPILVLGFFLYMALAMHVIDPVRWLSSALPASFQGAIAVSVLVLAGLGAALYAMFRQVEFADKPGRGIL